MTLHLRKPDNIGPKTSVKLIFDISFCCISLSSQVHCMVYCTIHALANGTANGLQIQNISNIIILEMSSQTQGFKHTQS